MYRPLLADMIGAAFFQLPRFIFTITALDGLISSPTPGPNS